MSRHIRTTCKIAGNEEGMEKLYDRTLTQRLEEQNAHITQLETQLGRLQPPSGATHQQAAARKALTHTPTGAFVYNTAVAQQSTYNAPVSHHHTYNINVFGSEQLPHIDRQVVKAIMDTAMGASQSPTNAALMVLLKAATLIYSDPDHPENLTCYLPNKKHDTVMVHGESGWEVQPMQLVIPPMATKCCDVLFMNQPFEHAERYGDLMTALRYNETAFKDNREMRTVLVRNKILLERALGALPITK